MFGVSAPSQADSLLALAKFVQSPELQQKLEEFQKAEAAANSAAASANDLIQRSQEAVSAATAKMGELDELKARLEGLPAKEAEFEEKCRAREAAIANRAEEVTKGEQALAVEKESHFAWVNGQKGKWNGKSVELQAREDALAAKEIDHEQRVSEHEDWLGGLKKLIEGHLG